MKRISYMFCLMLAALVGCQQEDVIREVVSRGPVFRAAQDQHGRRSDFSLVGRR